MNNDGCVTGVAVLAATFAILLVLLWGVVAWYQMGYRDGQIDSLNGDVHFEKQEQPNGEVLWVKVAP